MIPLISDLMDDASHPCDASQLHQIALNYYVIHRIYVSININYIMISH